MVRASQGLRVIKGRRNCLGSSLNDLNGDLSAKLIVSLVDISKTTAADTLS